MKPVLFPEFPKVALLDWDGTFCDSRESIYEINRVMAEHYAQKMPLQPLPSYEDWLQVSHPGVEACMRSLGVTDDRKDINDFFHHLLLEQRESGLRNPLYQGTKDLLCFLQERKIPAVIISRHLHEHLVLDIEDHGLSSYFEEIIGEPDDGELEKDVVMRYVCDELGVPYGKAFYLGDTSHDMRLASKARVCAIAVSHGYDPVSELEKEKPAHIFGSLPEFQRFLSWER